MGVEPDDRFADWYRHLEIICPNGRLKVCLKHCHRRAISFLYETVGLFHFAWRNESQLLFLPLTDFPLGWKLFSPILWNWCPNFPLFGGAQISKIFSSFGNFLQVWKLLNNYWTNIRSRFFWDSKNNHQSLSKSSKGKASYTKKHKNCTGFTRQNKTQWRVEREVMTYEEPVITVATLTRCSGPAEVLVSTPSWWQAPAWPCVPHMYAVNTWLVVLVSP